MQTRTIALLILLALPAAALAQAPAQDAPRWRLPRFGGGRNDQPAQPEQPQAAPAEAPAQLPPPPAVVDDTPTPRREPRAEETRRPRTTPKPKPKEEASEEPKPKPKAKPDSKSPDAEEAADQTTRNIDAATSAVGDFLKEGNNGYYSKAAAYLTPQLQKYFDSEISAPMGGLMSALDRITREGTIRLVRYSNWRGRGELGRIDAEITFASGQAEKRAFDLMKIDGKWRLVIPVDGGGATPTTAAAPAPPPPAATPAPPPEAAEPQPTPARPATQPQSSAPASSTPKPVEAFAKIDAAIRAEADASTQSALSDAPWKSGN